MINYRAYEELTPIYDKYLTYFSVTNCFWKGVNVLKKYHDERTALISLVNHAIRYILSVGKLCLYRPIKVFLNLRKFGMKDDGLTPLGHHCVLKRDSSEKSYVFLKGHGSLKSVLLLKGHGSLSEERYLNQNMSASILPHSFYYHYHYQFFKS